MIVKISRGSTDFFSAFRVLTVAIASEPAYNRIIRKERSV